MSPSRFPLRSHDGLRVVCQRNPGRVMGICNCAVDVVHGDIVFGRDGGVGDVGFSSGEEGFAK